MATENTFKTFISLGSIVITIAVSSVIGFNFLASSNEKAIAKALLPIVESIKEIKEAQKILRSDMTKISTATNGNFICLNRFLTYYNIRFHQEFLRPADITEKSIITE